MAELTTGQAVKQSARTMSKSWSDRLKVATAKTSSTSNKDIDIAIVKATTCRFHVVPKEKHVVTLKYVISGSKTGGSYVAGALLKRLHTATDWLTALKTLIVVHRLIRETDAAAFMEELLRAGGADARGRGGRVLNVDNFLDTTNIEGRFDYSEWVRGYGKYIDETLETFSAIAWQADVESAGTESKLRSLSPKDLLQQMPYLQRLQRRLVDCLPRGQAATDEVVLLSLSMVVRESFKLYKALSEGVINLADCFFSMEYLDAVKGLEVYREALASGEALATYYGTLQNVHAFRSAGDLPVLSQPPADFVEEMEAYIKDAPRPDGIGGGSGGGALGESASGSGSFTAARRNVPLRKGRLAVQSSLKGSTRTASSGDGGAIASGLLDPGMVMAAGAAAVPSSPQKNEEQVEEESTAAIQQEEEEVVPAPESQSILDLLGFDEDVVAPGSSGANGQGEAEGQGEDHAALAAAAVPVQPSAMDLLGELDFGAMMNLGGNGSNTTTSYNQQQQQQHAAALSSPSIPDSFVVRAAADVYGRPPPLHEAISYASSSISSGPGTAGSTAVGFYGLQTPGTSHTPSGGVQQAVPPPWMTQQQYNPQQYQQQQQQQLPVQYSYTTTSPAYQPQQQQFYGGVGATSGFVNFNGQQQQQWGSPSTTGMGATPPGGRDPQLIRQAGAHDPFSALPGLPSSP